MGEPRACHSKNPGLGGGGGPAYRMSHWGSPAWGPGCHTPSPQQGLGAAEEEGSGERAASGRKPGSEIWLNPSSKLRQQKSKNIFLVSVSEAGLGTDTEAGSDHESPQRVLGACYACGGVGAPVHVQGEASAVSLLWPYRKVFPAALDFH